MAKTEAEGELSVVWCRRSAPPGVAEDLREAIPKQADLHQLLPGWPRHRNRRVYSQFIVGDLDGDPAPEGFMGPCRTMGDWAFNVDGFPIESNHKMGTGAGTLADLDHDGDTDIIMQFDDSVRVYDTPGVWDADRIDCARWMYDNRIVRDLNDESHAPALAGALHSGRIPLSPQIATDRP